MAYDDALADRFRAALRGRDGISEKRMMGGLCLFANGNMIGGVDRSRDGTGRFMFRVGKGNAQAAEQLPGAELVVMGGRRMAGFYFVAEQDCGADMLEKWVALALGNALSLPPK